MVLPTDVTKVVVYSKYKHESGFQCASKSKFYQLWQEVLPHISDSRVHYYLNTC